MKAGWHKKKLGDVLKLEYGKPLDATNRNPNGLYPVYGANGEKDRSDSFFYDKPSIIVGRKGSAGEVNLTEERFWPLDVTYYVTFDEKNYDLQFLYYLLLHLELPNLAKGVKPGINRNEVYSLSVNISSLPEQQRIVAILDEAFEAIAAARANAEQNRQNARALFESYLQSVFSQRGDGWINKPLSELCDIKHGFAFKSEYFTNEGDYTLLTPGNFFETGGYRDRGDKQKFYSGDIPQGFLLEAGDLLVAMTEQAAGLLGSPIIVPSQGKFLHNQRLGLISGKPGIPWLNEFFFHVFNTQAVRQAIHESASGAKVRHTSPTKIGAVTVAFPASIEEQKAIVATLDTLTIETQRLESLYQRKIAALDELKQSLLQQAFSGQL
ncbi:restriction endonuclease subunit S [Aeromonas enteropelogenes]|uniref:Restriction endonuclease subunit S n=1 Tax=Aeromonas enteropelogenes TaxID=29489 RepID=A0ABU9JCI1_AEREN